MAASSKQTDQHVPVPLKMTRRQRAIMTFIEAHIFRRGFAPSVREIGTEFEIRSPNGVVAHLKALERKGMIARGDGARAITILRPRCFCSLPFGGRIS